MKRAIKLWMLTFVMLAAFGTVSAQKKKKGEPAPPPTDASRFAWEKSKLIPKMQKLAIAQLTVTYKLTTTAKTIAKESRSGGEIAGARVTGFLEFTDSEPTQADFQALTDHFYRYFQKKLKENGIDTVGWNEMTAHEFYQKIDREEGNGEDTQKEGGGNKWVTCNANKGKIVHKGMAGFAGGKGKRAMEFGKEFGNAVTLKVNVDFADVHVNLEVKSTDRTDIGGGWYYPATSSKKYTWGVQAKMMVGDQDVSSERTLLWAGRGFPEFLYQWSDIPVEGNYAESVTEDVSKARGGVAKAFAFRKELTPVLIQTTREKYLAAAKNAVEKWSDAFCERIVLMRKS